MQVYDNLFCDASAILSTVNYTLGECSTSEYFSPYVTYLDHFEDPLDDGGPPMGGAGTKVVSSVVLMVVVMGVVVPRVFMV